MKAPLDKIVKITPDSAFKITQKVYGEAPLDPALYQVVPGQSENDRNITLREVIDRKKLAHIVTHPDDYELGSRFIKGQKLEKDAQLTLLQDYLARTNTRGNAPCAIISEMASEDIRPSRRLGCRV